MIKRQSFQIVCPECGCDSLQLEPSPEGFYLGQEWEEANVQGPFFICSQHHLFAVGLEMAEPGKQFISIYSEPDEECGCSCEAS